MKKAVLILLTLVLIAGFASAQGVKIGAWGRGFLEIAAGTADGQEDPIINPAIGWWTGNGPRIGISIIGSSDSVGFQLDMNVDPAGYGATSSLVEVDVNGDVVGPVPQVDVGGTPTDVAIVTSVTGPNFIQRGDQQKIWVKPIDMLTIQLGYSLYDDALRGNASFGMYNWIRHSGMPGDGFIFQRVGKVSTPYGGDSAGANFEIALDPMEGLHIFAGMTPGAGAGTLLEDAIVTDAMYGAGYTIPGIGMARFQFLSVNEDLGRINAAFKLTAVSGLGLDIGAWIPTDAEVVGEATYINLTASYAVMPTLTLNAIGSIALFTEEATAGLIADGYTAWYGGIEGEYALPMDLVATVDVRLTGTTVEDSDMGWGFLAAIQKNFSNGLVGLGLELTNLGFAGPAPSVVDMAKDMVWAVPLRLEYWF